ncbi:MAG: acylase, partial [Pseudomonadota bacterium]
VYALDNPEDGAYTGYAGDTYILYADWAPDGEVSIETIHQFGAATVDASSPHYADQAPIFAQEAFRTPPMALDDLIAEATTDKRIGGRLPESAV